ncbi:nucleolin [Anopheles funestus]|uniref:nucleolin n=1 Tax=Anopheles funestus TaxID=62324 RepID=UPI0020C6A1B5|nr:nucleolin [Anopheles funestus]
MGKSSQIAMDPDSSSDRITARVGSRTKKAKIVFDPSDHHVPRKRNRRGENDSASTGTAKLEPSRTTTPLSSSSTEGTNYNSHTPATSSTVPAVTVGHRGTASGTLCRLCQKCGRNGPGRMPRKTPLTPWTCSACLFPKTDSKAAGNKQGHPKSHTKSVRDRTAEEFDNINDEEKEEEEQEEDEEDDEEEEEEEDNKQQHDFAGFSETELCGHGNVNDAKPDERIYVPIKPDPNADSDGDVADTIAPSKSNKSAIKTDHSNDDEGDESAKDIRYWSCDDVCRFFSRHCRAWGDLFHEQEIDGASLLLMRKGDVLSRFGLKLGPAMELYQRIVALQNGDRDIVDVRLTWI